MHDDQLSQAPFYVKELLTADERAEFEQHLKACAMCQEDVRQWQQVADAISAEAGAWIPRLVPPPLGLSSTRVPVSRSGDGRNALNVASLESRLEVASRHGTVGERRRGMSTWRQLSRLLAAALLLSVVASAVFVLAVILLSVEGHQPLGALPGFSQVVTPTAIPSPTPTLPPTPVPLPPPEGLITLDNADQVVELKVLKLPAVTRIESGGNSLAWAPNGRRLAVATDTGVYVAASANFTFGSTWRHLDIGRATAVAFSPDGALLALGGTHGTVEIWDLEAWQPVLTIERAPNAVPGPASITDGGVAVISDLSSESVWSIAFSPDGSLLAVGRGDSWVGPGSFRLYDAATGELRFNLVAQNDSSCCDMESVYGVAFSPDGTLVAGALGGRAIGLWDVRTGENQAIFGASSFYVGGGAFGPKGSVIAVGDGDGATHLLDTESGEVIAQLRGGQGTFSPDGTVLATALEANEGALYLWDAATTERLVELPTPNIVTVTFSPDGTMLATTGDEIVTLWGLQEYYHP